MSANEELLEAQVDHAARLIGYTNGVVRRMLGVLRKTEPDLFAKLQSALERLPSDSFTVQRLERLMASVDEITEQGYKRLEDDLRAELGELAAYEVEAQKNIYEKAAIAVSFESVAASQVYAGAMAQPFNGRLLKEWFKGLEDTQKQRLRDAIRIGYVQNEPIAQIIQRIRGTRALKFKDGFIEIDRRNAEAIVRTAVNHTANYAQTKFLEANEEVIKGVKLIETLDHRTCAYCASLDGKVYAIGKGPRPPHHVNCRGSQVGVMKSWRELGFDLDELPAGTRASLDGQVPADVRYPEWLKKKPASFQDEVLGKTRGKLFRDGELPIDRFVNRNGYEYTLAELREREAEAFSRAGV